MPVIKNYNGGSIIYFEGDKAEEIYVLQSGRVVLISTSIDTGDEVREDVQIGEFFGVKSCLGKYPREETAQVIGKTNVIVFKQPEFEQMVMKNTRLIIKMLKVFSKQLREIHRNVRQILKAGSTRDPEYELMNVAESFYKSGNIDHAIYAFERYLTYYPGGPYSSRAADLLTMARKGQTYPHGYVPLESVAVDTTSYGVNDSIIKAASLPASSADDPFAFPEDPFFDEPSKPETPPATRSATELLQDARELFNAGDYTEALKQLEGLLSRKDLSKKPDLEAKATALFEKGRCLIKLKKLPEAANALTEYLKTYPSGSHVKQAFFQLGLIAEISGNNERARTFYAKVAQLKPDDDVTAQAKARLQKIS
jgi:TolA-binding protein